MNENSSGARCPREVAGKPSSAFRALPAFGVPLGLVALVVILLCANSGEATSGRALTLDELVRAAGLIVVGTIEQVDVLPRGPRGAAGIHRRVRVQLDDVLHGGHDEGTLELWALGGRLDDRLRIVPGSPRFSPGQRVGLFLFRARGAWWTVGLGAGRLDVLPGSTGGPLRPDRGATSRLLGSAVGAHTLVELRATIRRVHQ